MGVKTIFKILIGTAAFIPASMMMIELFNVSVASIEVRRLADAAAYQSCALYMQETFRATGEGAGTVNGTVDAPDIKYGSEGSDKEGQVLYNGKFYTDYDDGTPTSSSVAYQNKVYENMFVNNTSFKNLFENGSCTYSVSNGGRSPVASTASIQVRPKISTSNPGQLTGTQSNILQLGYGAIGINSLSYKTKVCVLEDPYLLFAGIKYKGGLNPTSLSFSDIDFNTTPGQDAAKKTRVDNNSLLAKANTYYKNMYTPANVGFPYIDNKVGTRMLKYNLTTIFSGGESDAIRNLNRQLYNENESSSISFSDDRNDVASAPYIRYKGFTIYPDTAYVSNITYFVYDMADKDDFNKDFGYSVKLKPITQNTQGIPVHDNQVVVAAQIDYKVDITYSGVTPMQRVYSYFAGTASTKGKSASNVVGMEGLVESGGEAALPPTRIYSTYENTGEKTMNSKVATELSEHSIIYTLVN